MRLIGRTGAAVGLPGG